MIAELVYAIWLIGLGAAGGSFMAAFADRFAAGQRWVYGRSACAECGQKIAVWDLVPLVSFLVLRGKCRHCGRTIALRSWLAEVSGLAAACASLLLGTTPGIQIGSTVFLVILLGLFLCDQRTMRLPDVLTGALVVAGMWLGVQWHGLAMSMFALGLGVAVFWGLAVAYRRLRGREGLGMGDVKMMAGLAAMAGPFGLPWLTLFAAVAPLTVTAFRRRAFVGTHEVPFGCYLALSGALVWVLIVTGLL